MLTGSVIVVRLFFTEPVFIMSDYFEPEFEKCHYYHIDKRFKQYSTGDVVITTDYKVGKVKEFNNNIITIESEKGLTDVNRNEIRGKVIKTKGFTAVRPDCNE